MSEPFIGEIRAFGFNFAPRSWAKCDGQLLQISQNSALFSLLGTIYGGDGRTTFGLPELRGRVPMHTGTGPGLSNRPIGQRSGQEEVTLNVQQLPSHFHTVEPGCNSGTGNNPDPTGNYPANALASLIYHNQTDNSKMGTYNTGNTGNNQAHNNMQPYLVINWCIAVTGLFPS